MQRNDVAGLRGLATLQTLAGALGVHSFTVQSLADAAGLPPKTVDSVVRRHEGLFDRLGVADPAGPGRPNALWRVRPEARRNVLGLIENLQANIPQDVLPTPALPPIEDQEDALVLALGSLRRALEHGTEVAPATFRAIESSLRSAGLDPQPLVSSPPPENGSETELVGGLLATVTSLLRAEQDGDSEGIDEFLAASLPWLQTTKHFLSAESWVPIARRVADTPGNVLFAPLRVLTDNEALAHDYLPGLEVTFDEASPPPDDSDLVSLLAKTIRKGMIGAQGHGLTAFFFDSLASHVDDLMARDPVSPSACGPLVCFRNYDAMGAKVAFNLGAALVPLVDPTKVQAHVVRAVNHDAMGLIDFS